MQTFVGDGARKFVVEVLDRAGITKTAARVQECWARADAEKEKLDLILRDMERRGNRNGIVGANMVQHDSRGVVYYQFYWPQAAYVRHAEELLKAGSRFGTLAVTLQLPF